MNEELRAAPAPPAHADVVRRDAGLAYNPALDGLRAFAVLAVMLFHFDVAWTPGGFLGVDVFFVLSGYLITSLLVLEWRRTGAIDLAGFWGRRARRLLPALFAMLMAVAAWTRFAVPSDRFDAVRSDAVWTLFYGANWHFIAAGRSYFDAMSEASPLRHAWSLAIEEQFYVLWPLLALAVLRVAKGRSWLFPAICMAGAALSALAMSMLYDGGDPTRVYFGTDTRIAPLLVGATLALLVSRRSPPQTPQPMIRVTGLAGCLLCLVAVAVVDARSWWMYRGGYLAFEVAAAAWILALVRPDGSLVQRALSASPMVWIGRRSYGAYLWHWPVAIALSAGRTDLDGAALFAVRVATTFALAAVCFAVIEAPIRWGTWIRGRRTLLGASLGSAATAAAIVLATTGGTAAPSFLREDAEVEAKAPSTPRVPLAATEDRLGVSRVLLIGDSVAATLAGVLQQAASERGVTLLAKTRPGCGLTTGIPLWDDGSVVAWGSKCSARLLGYQQEAIRSFDPDVIVWLSTWETSDQNFAGNTVHFGTPEGDAALLAELESARKRMTINGVRLVLVTLPPPPEQSDVHVLRASEGERREHLNALFRDFAARYPRTVGVADLASLVCPNGRPCQAKIDGVTLRPRDGNHFERDGPAWVGPRLYAEIIRTLASMT